MSLCGNVSTFPVKHKGKAKKDSAIECRTEACFVYAESSLSSLKEKVRKGAWRMPRLKEAMKDVISCVKPR